MDKNRHDELMALVTTLSVGSPRSTIRRALRDLRNQATGLRWAVAWLLLRAGVLTSQERDGAPVEYDELAEAVAMGGIALDDKRIATVSELAAKLRAVTVAAIRLERLLTIDPNLRTAEYISRLYEAGSDYIRHTELWASPAGWFAVRHLFIEGLFGQGWEGGWITLIHPADQDGKIMAEDRPMGGSLASSEDDGPVPHDVIQQAIGRLSFDQVVRWISTPR